MDDWRQVAIYFYFSTVALAGLIVMGFLTCKVYKDSNEKGTYGACVSEDEDNENATEEEINLEMKQMEPYEDGEQMEPYKDEEEMEPYKDEEKMEPYKDNTIEVTIEEEETKDSS